ncbi:microtubule-associated serine/threonine-protein kinase 3-like isoform X2 [Ranitomeya variabilis]|uniref:microtubule-associated serine/threonine-protein kinase 3-like isoform X2 n=1 Tax=Ranitomeya variabilis TaxID=490064 RepID=UPI004057B0F4
MIPKTNIYKQLAEDIIREFKDHQVCGTPYYIAPEVIMKKGYERPVDWWSMGIILHEFLVGFVPFWAEAKDEICKNVAGDVVWSNYNPIPPFVAQNLVNKLLIKVPAYRLGTEGAFEIKGYPFLSDLDFDNLLSQKPEYIPQLASALDISSSINQSDINKHLVSEDEDENESFNFQNFISSSERLSKLCTIAISGG